MASHDTHGKSTMNYKSSDRVGGLGWTERLFLKLILQDGFVMRTVPLNGGTSARHDAFCDVCGRYDLSLDGLVDTLLGVSGLYLGRL